MAIVLFFGISKDLTKTSEYNLRISDNGLKVSEIKNILFDQYPGLSKVSDVLVAINTNYAEDDEEAHDGDEIAIIPPTNGG